MRRSMGQAMSAMVAGKPSNEVRDRRKLFLASPQRRSILRYLCLRPCASQAELSEATGFAPSTLPWHLARLTEAGYLAKTVRGAFFPRGLLAPEDVPFFEELSRRSSRSMLSAILQHPGGFVSHLAKEARISRQLASSSLGALQRLGIAAIVLDGRYRRAYPTAQLRERRDAQRERSRHFSDLLLARLEGEGLMPEVVRRTDSQFVVRIGPERHKVLFEVPLDPLSTSLRRAPS